MKYVAQAAVMLAGLAALAIPVQAHPEIEKQIADVTAQMKESPKDATLLLRRGELHRIHREWDLAAADFAGALDLDPGLTRVHLSAGRLELDAGRPARALKATGRYLATDPHNVKALALKGRALHAMGKHVAAARAFDQALAANDLVAEHYIERARALEAAGKRHLAEAIRGLDAGVARLGKAPTLELLAIDLELQRGAHASAVERIDRVIALANRKDPWIFRKAEILESAGKTEEARALYADVLRKIEELPASRRATRAARDLAADAQAALDRLSTTGGGGS
jgi:tetratricopeptide (TPR) repeat protein